MTFAFNLCMSNFRAPKPSRPAHIVLCPPDYFEVSYKINPWMDPECWARQSHDLQPRSRREWVHLYQTLKQLGASIELMPAQQGVPDIVFVANSAVVLNGKALLARFRHHERRAEEPHLAAFFSELKNQGKIEQVIELPEGIIHEGAGDALWDPARELFWVGYGPRSEGRASACIENFFDREVVSIELVDEHFYHLDTCLCPLSGGQILYYSPALSCTSRERLKDIAGPKNLIEVSAEDASSLAVNAINIGKHIIMPGCRAALEARLNYLGYTVHRVPLTSFAASGGAAFCLSLRLDQQSHSSELEAVD